MKNILKYKHYLLIILALLIIEYMLIPLGEWQKSQQQSLQLLQKKQDKINNLLADKNLLSNNSTVLDENINKLNELLYQTDDEANFKLIAQTQIEKALLTANCKIERLGFKGNTPLENGITKWQLEVRYTGEVMCLLNTTRTLEMMNPHIHIESYDVNSRGFDNKAEEAFNAQLNISIWHRNNKQENN